MLITQEILGYLENIRYYSGKIKDLAKTQMEQDWQAGEQKGDLLKLSGTGSIRFKCLACVQSASELIDIYCSNIEANVKTAESQDKILR